MSGQRSGIGRFLSSARVTSLTDNVLKFSHDDTRPMGFPRNLKRGQVREMFAALVHQTFRLITQRRPKSLLDAPHAITRLRHGSLLTSLGLLTAYRTRGRRG